MRISTRRLPWFLVLLSTPYAAAAQPVRLQDGGYRFQGELYQASVDRRGRLASLQVNGQEVLLPPAVNAKVYDAENYRL